MNESLKIWCTYHRNTLLKKYDLNENDIYSVCKFVKQQERR